MKDDDRKSVIYGATLLVISLLIAIFICGCESIRWRHHEESITMTTTTEEPLATTTTTTITTTTTTTFVTTTTTMTTITTTTTTTDITTTDPSKYLNYIGEFTGKYYRGDYNPCFGGSGRLLDDCTPKSDEMKGSVACRYIQENFGYNVNGRTRVYLELPSYPDMNGFYWVDDACASSTVVDFYFMDYSTNPWQNDGITDVHLWMEVF